MSHRLEADRPFEKSWKLRKNDSRRSKIPPMKRMCPGLRGEFALGRGSIRLNWLGHATALLRRGIAIMSNLRKTDGLLILTARLSVLVLFAMSGCSSLTGSRLGALEPNPNVKTRLAVGDKALSVVTGEPGASVADDEPASSSSPRRRSNADNRVSGRVYDDHGEPVDGATVRLAVNGTPGGRVNRVTTDPSGGFTLRGLRPDTPYTLIAEWDGTDGPMSGRIETRTSDTELKITLAPLDARSEESARVNRVSDQAEIDSEDLGQRRSRQTRRPVVNEEDLPPAIEADAVESPSRPRRATTKDRWESGGKKVDGAASANSNSDQPVVPQTPFAEDDGPNPLPPAIEPATGSNSKPDPLSSRESAARGGGKLAIRDSDELLPPAASRSARSKRAKRADAEIAKQDDDTIPGALVVVPETFAPVVIDDSQLEGSADVSEPATASRKTPSTRISSAAAQPLKKPIPRSRTESRPTWGEVVATTSELPPLQGNEGHDEVAQRPEKHLDADDNAPDWTKPPAPPAPSTESSIAPNDASAGSPRRKDDATVLCDYDEKHRKLNDFRLPDLQGRSVRFQDLDADLILLDFWGTWCPPCLKSIPRLVELQAKNPGKKFLVVGIACEQGDFNQATRNVATAAAKLKINYPILMSRNDGSCPLQEALHIQAFPTLVLVDREGRVVWRDQGATPATIARLERLVLETAPRSAASRLSPSRL